MDENLKIILSADLEKDSLQNIEDRLKELKNALSKDFTIGVKLDDKLNSNIKNLIENLDALNRRLTELNTKQLNNLQHIGQAHESNARQIRESLKSEVKETRNLITSQEHLLKQRTRFQMKDDIEHYEGATQTFGNKQLQETISLNKDNERVTRNVTLNQKQLNEEYKKMSQIANQILDVRSGDRTSEERRFLELHEDLNHENQNYLNVSREINDLYDYMIQRQKTLNGLAEHRANIERRILEVQDAGAGKGITKPAQDDLRKLSDERIRKEINGLNEIADLEDYVAKKIDETNSGLARTNDLEKTRLLRTEQLADAQKRINELAEQGHNVAPLRDLLKQSHWQQESEVVAENFKRIFNEMERLPKFEQKMESMQDKAQKLGLQFDKTFTNLGANEKLTVLMQKLEALQQQINYQKQQGLALDQQELAITEKQIRALQMEASLEKRNAEIELANLKEANRIQGDRIAGREDQVKSVFDEKSVLRQRELAKELAKEVIETNHAIHDLDTELAKVTPRVDKFGNKMLEVSYEVEVADNVFKRFSVAIDQVSNGLYDLGDAGRQARSIQTADLWTQMEVALKRVPIWMASLGLFYGGLHQIQQSFQTLLEVDTAFTNLAKVTEATTGQFEDFKQEAVGMAQELGMSTVAVTDAITEFQRLGYTLEQSTGLGEIATIYANVGDMETPEASNYLISAMQGFNVAQEEAVETAERYSDAFNEVGNNFAVTSAGIGDALKRSSASLYEAGNSFEQSIGLIASANAVIQNEAKVGNALKTISMRLRGVDEETGEVIKIIPELESTFNRAGLTMMEDADTFKSTFEILQELSEIWNKGVLTDMEKANLIELIGGKEQGNVVSAILNNFSDATEASATALHSAGSASEEFTKYQESMAYKLGQLQASVEEFWLTFWNTEGVENAIELLTKLVNIATDFIDSAGSLSGAGGVLLGLGALMSRDLREAFVGMGASAKKTSSNVNQIGIAMGEVGEKTKNTSGEIKNASVNVDAVGTAMDNTTKKTNKATQAIVAFGKATIVGALVGMAINAVIDMTDDLIETQDERLSKLQEEYDLQMQVNDAVSQIDTKRLSDLEMGARQGTLNTEEMSEYKNLQQSIINSNPELISHYDEMGNAILKSASEIERLNKANREQLQITREQIIEEQKKEAGGFLGRFGQDFFNDFEKDLFGIRNETLDLEDAVNKVGDNKEKLTQHSEDLKGLELVKNILPSQDIQNLQQGTKAFSQAVTDVRTKLNELEAEGKISGDTARRVNSILGTTGVFNIDSRIDGLIEQIEDDKKKTTDELDEFESDVSDKLKEVEDLLVNQFENFLDDENIDLESSARVIADDLNKSLTDALLSGGIKDVEDVVNNYQKYLSDAFDELSATGVAMEDFAIDGGTEEAREALNALIKEFGAGTPMGQIFTQMLNAMSLELKNVANSANQAQTLNNFTNERITILDNYAQKATFLAETLQAVTEGHGLEIDQIQKLVALHPELAGAIEHVNNTMTIKSEAIRQVMADLEGQSKSELEIVKANIENRISEVTSFIKGREMMIRANSAFISAQGKAVESAIDAQAKIYAMGEQANYMKTMGKYDLEQQLFGSNYKNMQNMIGGKDIYASKTSQQVYNEAFSKFKNEQIRSGQDEIASLQNELAIINAVLGTDLSAHVRSTATPSKASKPKKTGGKDTQKSETEELIYVTDEFKNTMRDLNNQILKQQEIMMNFPSYSKDYQKALQTEIGLINDKIKAIDNEEKSLQKQIDQKNIEKKGLVKKSEATGGGGGGITSTLRVGSTGSAVRKLQEAVGAKVDGIYGNETRAKVMAYQKSHGGLSVDGIAGKNTLTALGLYGAKGGGGGGTVHTVKRGESLSGIAKKYGVDWRELAKQNNISNPNRINVGQKINIGGGGKSTANASAEVQQAIDQAKDELAGLGQEKAQLRQEYYDKVFALVESEVARLDREAKKIEDDLVDNDFMASKLDEQSQAWRNNRDERLKLLQVQAKANADSIAYLQKEITNAETVLNEKLEDAVYDLLDEQKIAYTQMQREIYELQRDIAQSVIDEIIEGYQDQLALEDRNLSEIQRQLSRIDETDIDQFTKKQEELIDVYKRQLEINKSRLSQLKNEEGLVKQFPDLYEQWKDQVIELEESQKDLNQTIWDVQKDTLDSHNDAIDNVIDLYKEYYEERRDLELEALEDTRKAEEKFHEERVKRWEKELEAYEESISKQLEALDKAEQERSYEKDLTSRQEQRQQLMNTIGLVSLDSTPEGRARLRQLQQELKTVTEEISDMQNQKRLEARREALEKELEARQKETEELIESETERYEKEQEEFEKYVEEIERKWENIIENERKFAQIRTDLLTGNMSEMSETIESFMNIIAKNSGKIGESISQNLIDNFATARKELEELDAVLTENQISFNDIFGKENKVTVDMINNIPMANALTTANVNNIPTTATNNTGTNQQITISFNIENLQGGQEGADQLLDALVDGLTRKGVSI